MLLQGNSWEPVLFLGIRFCRRDMIALLHNDAPAVCNDYAGASLLPLAALAAASAYRGITASVSISRAAWVRGWY